MTERSRERGRQERLNSLQKGPKRPRPKGTAPKTNPSKLVQRRGGRPDSRSLRSREGWPLSGTTLSAKSRTNCSLRQRRPRTEAKGRLSGGDPGSRTPTEQNAERVLSPPVWQWNPVEVSGREAGYAVAAWRMPCINAAQASESPPGNVERSYPLPPITGSPSTPSANCQSWQACSGRLV